MKCWAYALLACAMTVPLVASCNPPSQGDDRQNLACDRLFEAQAEQVHRCLNTTLPPDIRSHMRARFRAQCKQAFQLPGSSTSVEQLDACAQATAVLGCRDTNTPAACIGTPGHLEDGRPCNVSAQCKSLTCVFPQNSGRHTCGTCAPVTATGSTCGRDGTAACSDQNDCIDGVCVRDGTQIQGATCNRANSCVPGSTCVERKCVPLGTLGTACTLRTECADGFTCLAGKCAAEIALGGDCSLSPRGCALGLLCEPATSVCVATTLARPNEACGQTLHTACAIGQCSSSSLSAVGACPAIIADGEPCSTTSGRACDSFSTCIDGRCQPTLGSVCR
jgi:hypothetical protein